MNQLGRLLRYSRPYTGHLLLSVLLMACVGAAQAITVRLIGPIFDRVLNPASADAPVLLFTIPLFKHKVYLDSFMPRGVPSSRMFKVSRTMPKPDQRIRAPIPNESAESIQ